MTQPLRCGLPTFLHARRIASTSPCPAGRREAVGCITVAAATSAGWAEC